jgi:hypothetical protein
MVVEKNCETSHEMEPKIKIVVGDCVTAFCYHSDETLVFAMSHLYFVVPS